MASSLNSNEGIELLPFDEEQAAQDHNLAKLKATKEQEDAWKPEWLKKLNYDPFTPERQAKLLNAVGPSVREFGTRAVGAAGDTISFFNELLGGKPGQTGLPTSEGTKEFLDKSSGYDLEPHSRGQEYATDIAGTLGSIAGLGGMNPTRAISAAFGGATAKQGAKELGFSDEDAAMVGAVTNIGMSLREVQGPRAVAEQSYRNAERFLPRNASVNATSLQRSLESTRRSLLNRSTQDPAAQQVIRVIDDILGQIQNGRIDIRPLVGRRTSVNSFIKDPEQRGVKNIFRHINRRLNMALDTYGQQNPQYLQELRRGDRIWEGLYNSRGIIGKAQSFMRDLKSKSTPLLFGLKPFEAIGYLAGGNILGGALNALRSPEIARVYGRALNHMWNNDLKGAVHYIKQTDKALKKYEDSNNGDIELID